MSFKAPLERRYPHPPSQETRRNRAIKKTISLVLGVAWDSGQNKVLVLSHQSETLGRNVLKFPGGVVAPGGDLMTSLVDFIYRELNVDCRTHELIFKTLSEEPGGYIDLWLFHVTLDGIPWSQGLVWLPLSELRQATPKFHASLAGVISPVLNFLQREGGLPLEDWRPEDVWEEETDPGYNPLIRELDAVIQEVISRDDDDFGS